jgi:2-iminobutanoate/2-iminopropanoate deaminase
VAGALSPSFEDQVAAVLDVCDNILAAAGCSLQDVVQCTAYIVGVDHWPQFNRAYAARFGAHKPARTVVPVAALRHGALIELQVNALKP